MLRVTQPVVDVQVPAFDVEFVNELEFKTAKGHESVLSNANAVQLSESLAQESAKLLKETPEPLKKAMRLEWWIGEKILHLMYLVRCLS